VVEQVLWFDGFDFAIDGTWTIRRRGPMTLPASVSHAFDVAVDPQLVHDFAETLNAGVGDKRAKICRFVPAVRFHMVEDEAGVFTQRMHHNVWVQQLTGQPEVNPASS
jgi:hypothetical protein